MCRAVHIRALGAVGDALVVAHFKNIYLAASGPAYGGDVVAHHPESRPQAVGSGGHEYRRLDFAVFEIDFSASVDASRCEMPSAVILPFGGEDKATVATAVVADRHVAGAVGVVLQFLICRTGSHFDIPCERVEARAVEKVLPYKAVGAGLAGAGLGFGSVHASCGYG